MSTSAPRAARPPRGRSVPIPGGRRSRAEGRPIPVGSPRARVPIPPTAEIYGAYQTSTSVYYSHFKDVLAPATAGVHPVYKRSGQPQLALAHAPMIDWWAELSAQGKSLPIQR